MDFIVNTYANISGLWKKIAAFLPMVAGAGSVLVGAGNICVEFSKADSAATALHIFQSLTTDPNTAMVIAGLTALGIHTNHTDNKTAIAATQTPSVPIPPATPKP